MNRWVRFAPAALLAAGGCVASKGDVRLLQDELRAMRSSVASADAARREEAQADRARADSVLRLMAQASDSLRALSSRFTNFQGNVRGELYDLGQQLLAVQELSGQSQRRMQEIRAGLEMRNRAMATQPVAPGAVTPPMTTDTMAAPPAGPGPAQLFQLAREQLDRGSYGAARTAFQQLLTDYPDFADAPLAQLYIAESFTQERNDVAADSVYRLVVGKYPGTPQAANALYKRALLLRSAGNDQSARTLLQQLVREYPRSDEAVLARDLLKPPDTK